MARVSRRAKGIAAVAFGFLLLLGAGFVMERAYRIANGKEVEGRVLAVGTGEVRVRFPGITKSCERGFSMDPERARTLRKGRRIGVVVVSDDEAYLQGDGPATLPLVLLFGLGAISIGGGAILILRPA